MTESYTSSRSSAEWVEEAPSSGRGVVALDNFGAVQVGGRGWPDVLDRPSRRDRDHDDRSDGPGARHPLGPQRGRCQLQCAALGDHPDDAHDAHVAGRQSLDYKDASRAVGRAHAAITPGTIPAGGPMAARLRALQSRPRLVSGPRLTIRATCSRHAGPTFLYFLTLLHPPPDLPSCCPLCSSVAECLGRALAAPAWRPSRARRPAAAGDRREADPRDDLAARRHRADWQSHRRTAVLAPLPAQQIVTADSPRGGLLARQSLLPLPDGERIAARGARPGCLATDRQTPVGATRRPPRYPRRLRQTRRATAGPDRAGGQHSGRATAPVAPPRPPGGGSPGSGGPIGPGVLDVN